MQQTIRDPRVGTEPKSTTEMPGHVPESGPWYRLSMNVLLAVIFLPPLGLVLAWRYSDWPLLAKGLATAWAMLVLFWLVLFFASLGPSAFSPMPKMP